jgi:hypothetical protein
MTVVLQRPDLLTFCNDAWNKTQKDALQQERRHQSSQHHHHVAAPAFLRKRMQCNDWPNGFCPFLVPRHVLEPSKLDLVFMPNKFSSLKELLVAFNEAGKQHPDAATRPDAFSRMVFPQQMKTKDDKRKYQEYKEDLDTFETYCRDHHIHDCEDLGSMSSRHPDMPEEYMYRLMGPKEVVLRVTEQNMVQVENVDLHKAFPLCTKAYQQQGDGINLRWKFHAAYNDTRNFQQKVILDMTRFPPSDELWGDHVNSVHRPSRKMCPNETDQGHFWETALVANHPFGSWEQYFSRKDLRRNKVHYLGTSTFGSHSFTQDHSTGFPLQ